MVDMNKSYEQILKDKDIDEALKYLKPRQTTYKATKMIVMIINELKDKGVISKKWWEEYVEQISKGVVVDDK